MAMKRKYPKNDGSAEVAPAPVEPVAPQPVAAQPVPVEQPVPVQTPAPVQTGPWGLQEVQSTSSVFHNAKTGEYIDEREVLLRILNTLESFKEE